MDTQIQPVGVNLVVAVKGILYPFPHQLAPLRRLLETIPFRNLGKPGGQFFVTVLGVPLHSLDRKPGRGEYRYIPSKFLSDCHPSPHLINPLPVTMNAAMPTYTTQKSKKQNVTQTTTAAACAMFLLLSKRRQSHVAQLFRDRCGCRSQVLGKYLGLDQVNRQIVGRVGNAGRTVRVVTGCLYKVDRQRVFLAHGFSLT
jgi:hypothetical protein